MLSEIGEWFYDLYRYSWMRNARSFVRNWIEHSNVIHTGLKHGRYYDKCTLLPEGMFNIIEQYISKDDEDAFSFINWETTEYDIKNKQTIIDVLHWYRVEEPELQKEYGRLLDLAYGKIKYVQFDNCVDTVYNGSFSSEERKDMQNRLRRIEEEIVNRNKEMMHKIVDLYPCLWT